MELLETAQELIPEQNLQVPQGHREAAATVELTREDELPTAGVRQGPGSALVPTTLGEMKQL